MKKATTMLLFNNMYTMQCHISSIIHCFNYKSHRI